MEQTVLIMAGIYLAIGCVLGVVAVVQIILGVCRKGFNETSKETLNLEYNNEGGSTPISLFVFPFIFMLFVWPLIFVCGPEQGD